METFLTCPKCGKESFHTKSKCDFCGADLETNQETLIANNQTESQEKHITQKTNNSISGVAKVGKKRQYVVIKDIEMPFASMVFFMVKWVIASIPALIILFGLFAIVAAIFGGIFGGILVGTSRYLS